MDPSYFFNNTEFDEVGLYSGDIAGAQYIYGATIATPIPAAFVLFLSALGLPALLSLASRRFRA